MVQSTEKLTVHSRADDIPEAYPDDRACAHGASEAGRNGMSIIDLAHLARMTMGEKRLEVEVLALFERQAGMLVSRMHGAAPKAVAALAHTLAGSARSIGAWEVARAAQEVERAARRSSRAETASAVCALGCVAARARAAIKGLLTTD